MAASINVISDNVFDINDGFDVSVINYYPDHCDVHNDLVKTLMTVRSVTMSMMALTTVMSVMSHHDMFDDFAGSGKKFRSLRIWIHNTDPFYLVCLRQGNFNSSYLT